VPEVPAILFIGFFPVFVFARFFPFSRSGRGERLFVLAVPEMPAFVVARFPRACPYMPGVGMKTVGTNNVGRGERLFALAVPEMPAILFIGFFPVFVFARFFRFRDPVGAKGFSPLLCRRCPRFCLSVFSPCLPRPCPVPQ
jgi:hypothetical protein